MTLVLLAALAVGSLTIAAYSHYRAEREKQRQRRIRAHSRQLERLTPAITALDVADEDAALAEQLNQIRLYHARALVACDPHSPRAQSALQTASGYRHIQRPMTETDLNMTQVRSGLDEALQLFRELCARAQISGERFHEIQLYLRQAKMLLEVQALEERAQSRLEKGDRRQAIRDYRAACSQLIQLPLETRAREARIADLKQRVSDLEAELG